MYDPGVADIAVKLSITVPADLLAEVRLHVGPRGVSGFVSRAIARELEREQLGAYLAELDEQHGPLPQAMLKEARCAWRKR